jgi:hypothetical protein
VRTGKEIESVGDTHVLENAEAEGRSSEDRRINAASEGDTPTGEGRERVKVRTGKETERETGTHRLEGVEGGSSENWETNKASKRHSLAGEGRGRVK